MWVIVDKKKIDISFVVIKDYIEFSAVVFQEKLSFFPEIVSYVEKRKNHTFKPHKTSLKISSQNQVEVVQHVPTFKKDSAIFRQNANEFSKIANHFRKMFQEMADEVYLEKLLN
jgi:hypothetical protein